jgi:hypothetical protein
MEKPIIVHYQWSAEEALLVGGLNLRYSAQGKKLRRRFSLVGIVFVGMGTITLSCIAFTPEKTKALILGSLFILMGLAYQFLGKFLLRWVTLKNYAKLPAKDLPVTYEFSDDKFSVKNPVSSSEMLWRIVSKILRTKEGFLLYVTDTQIHWLPVHGFENGEAVDRFAVVAKGEIVNYTDVR